MVHILIALQYDDKPKCQAAGCKDGFSCGPVQNWDTKEMGYACCNVPDCFPASAKVALENGKSVAMSELKIEDTVKSGELAFILKWMVYGH